MNSNEYKSTDSGDISPDTFEQELDTALASYSNAEPRFGLEKRVMANLRAERERVPARLWWRWPSVVWALFAIVLAISAEWRLSKPARHDMAGPVKLATATPHVFPPVPGLLERRTHGSARTKLRTRGPLNLPRLEQFPSPQPLSEQEKVLADYVARFREEAVLIARIDNEEFMRDQAALNNGSRTNTDLTEMDEKGTTNR